MKTTSEKEKKGGKLPSMFSLTRCGISSILYSVSSRSKSMQSIAGRSGEARGHDIFLSLSPVRTKKTNALSSKGLIQTVFSETSLRVLLRILFSGCKESKLYASLG